MKTTKLLFIPEYRWHREYESFTANPVDVNVSPDKAIQALTSGTTVTIGFVNYYVDNILGESNKGANINEED